MRMLKKHRMGVLRACLLLLAVCLLAPGLALGEEVNVYVQAEGGYTITEVQAEEIGPISANDISGWREESGYQYVLMGVYPQNDDEAREPVLWRVLANDGGKAFLLCEPILDVHRFDEYSNDFLHSEIRDWMNGKEFYGTLFNDAEKAIILEDKKLGKLILLSRDELLNPGYGFSEDPEFSDPNRVGIPTPFALSRLPWDYGDRLTYYTRTTRGYRSVDQIRWAGSVGEARVARQNVGVRPGMWVDLTQEAWNAGDGSLAFPYQTVGL